MVHLDQEALQTLKEVMEDDFALLINTFLQDSDKRLTTLEQLIGSVDADAIRRAAHSFKGSCSNVGAVLLASYCAELEHKGANNKIDNIQTDVERIQQEYDIVKKLLLDLTN